MRILIVPLLLMLVPLGAAAAEHTPDAAVAALWRALSNEPGASADVATLDRLFHADAVVFGGSYRDGAPVVQRKAATEFLAPYGKVSRKGFHECEIARVVQAYDRFAAVYSVVESRTRREAPEPDFVGVNSIQLYQAGTQWKILSLYYHAEKPGLPIAPAGARSGACID
ncbi:MAG: nuclear transport factor 2 family protein [Lysobacteraceae bacterium]|nr:MAG: nuclear transport factor 2 family protein [Xanthomonadaceae bacterium]